MPRDNDLPSYESLLVFQEVYARAIALSWEDANFKKALLKDAESALANYFGYKSPWNIELAVEESDQCEWDEKHNKWKIPKNIMKFGVPTKPDSCDTHTDCCAIALAAYNDAGPTYLFTCC